jgi:hypothetical protein
MVTTAFGPLPPAPAHVSHDCQPVICSIVAYFFAFAGTPEEDVVTLNVIADDFSTVPPLSHDCTTIVWLPVATVSEVFTVPVDV